MVLILSEETDLSSTQVIEWLDILQVKWIRVNREDKIRIAHLGDDIQFESDDIQFKLSDIKSFWFRRGFFNLKKESTGIDQFDEFHTTEMKVLLQYLYHRLEKIHHLDSMKNANVNKLIVSSVARDIGLQTPDDFIFSDKASLENLILNSKNNFITKSMCGDPRRDFDDFFIFNYTSKVNVVEVKTAHFFPSLVQNYIEKKYELRIFYLDGKCYSMAIFSQNDSQTSVDFRVYNKQKPNRRIPYQLPMRIEEKLAVLMNRLGLKSGSIDMIVTPEQRYVFLEVNPVGQFGMTSFPCNYNIEKRIAEYLSNEN